MTNKINTKLAVPSIHLNGTSCDELIEQYLDAINAGNEFAQVLNAASPNGRDYYVQGNEALKIAQNQWACRQSKLQEIINELKEIVQAIGKG